MRRLVLVAALLLGAFLAGVAAMLVALDRLFGGHGPNVALRREHRRALDIDVGTSG